MLRLMCTKARLVILLAFFVISCNATPNYVPRNGDIIFHTSRSSQSLAIQRATHSPYSHMGIVYVEAGEPSVYEAVQPVKLTRLDDWAKRGENGHFVVKRLRDADRLLTQSNVARMKAEGKKFQGRATILASTGPMTESIARNSCGRFTSGHWESKSETLNVSEISISLIRL